MVSRIIKKTPTKSIKDCRRNSRRKKTPVKSPSSSVVIATINESFFSCRRRLVKIFSKLVKIATPKRSLKKQGFKKLKKNADFDFLFPEKTPETKIAKPLFFALPPSENPEKPTIFLDLDETLIHSSADLPSKPFDFVVRPKIEGETMDFYVIKRPGVDEFLEFLSKKFEIVIFTAGLREYASLVLDNLDKNRVINHRLYRDSCRELDGKYVKDLAQMGRDLWKVAIIDDNPNSFSFQPENAIQIKPFIDDLQDNELSKLIRFFDACDGVKDIRDAVKLFAHDNLQSSLLD
ncbi:probable C-terminal domain small phosphatase [Chenopodium quinoa]|uniref:FCP1 homology domain-containing protein n=1 Tax=Chenopodium quinoa TaxID=63459 RepID=A0A803N7P9_CHEQI|nr:probable C-terminal domain small phosphatase [Chenopodium quinoa]